MNVVSITLSLLAGVTLGIFFYGGLWFTVRRLPWSRHPALLALASFWIRSVIAVGGLLVIVKQGWQLGLIAVVGFVLSRFVVTKVLPERGRNANAHNT